VNLKIRAMNWVTHATSSREAPCLGRPLGIMLTQLGSLVGRNTYREGAAAFASTIPFRLRTDTVTAFDSCEPVR
jgi:hypothetical protein